MTKDQGSESSQRRVRRPADKQDLLTLLTSAVGPFESYRDALVFAAALGYANQRRLAFSQTSEQIPWAYFVDANYEAFISMLAVGVTNDAQVLGKEKHAEKLLVFEEFANGGLGIIQDELANNAIRTPLEVISDMVIRASKRSSYSEMPDFAKLASELAE